MWKVLPSVYLFTQGLITAKMNWTYKTFYTEMTDRFGPIPKQVEDLFTTVRCRRFAIDLGFEKMTLKDNTMRCYFINRPDSPYFESDLFKRVLDYLQTGTNKARLKQAGKNFFINQR